MEIERKWLVSGWPDMDLPVTARQLMRQGYINVSPTVRIREEQEIGEEPEYILCFKSAGGLAREEIETPVTAELFGKLEKLIGLPLISKFRKTYELEDGLKLEVNIVDEGTASEFMYAEIEFESVAQALSWTPGDEALAEYLKEEVTNQPGQTMGAYWLRTRGRG